MKKIREIIIILLLAVVLTLTAEFLAGFIIFNVQTQSIEKEFAGMTEYHSDSSVAKTGGLFDDVFNDMRDKTLAELAAEYNYAGMYYNNGITFFGDSLPTPVPGDSVGLSIENADEVGDKSISSYLKGDIFGSMTPDKSTEFLVYAYKISDEHVVVLEPAVSFLARFNENYFDNFAVLSQTGRVCMTNYAAIEGMRADEIGRLIGRDSLADFASGVVNISGTKYFAVYKNLNDAFGEFGFFGLVDYSRIDAALAESLGWIIFVLLMFGLSVVLIIAALAVYMTIKRQRSFKPKEIGTGNFNVSVNASGEIIKSNAAFRRFSNINIFDAVINKDLELNYNLGSSLICCLIDHGKQKIVSFVIVEKDDRSNFRMIGVKVAAEKAEEYAKQINNDFSLKFGFKNRFLKAASMDNPKVVFGLIEITNLRKLQTMFGPKVARDVNDATEERIRKYAETVYPLDSQYKGILISSGKEIDFFMSDIKAFFGELNKPVSSGDMLVDVSVVGGLVSVDSYSPDKTYNYTWKCAQAALKRVYSTDGTKYFVYHESVKKQYMRFFDYDFDIGKMLEENQFEMQYQPQLSIKDNKVVAFEALFRVKEHLGLQVDIGRLIDYIQYEGQIGMVGKFTFENCMRFAEEINGSKMKLSVNVSPLQFMQVGFVSGFAEMVGRYKIDPKMIDIEITETFLVGNIEEAANKIKELKKYGIGVHLDDFGKEYSSLNYLNKMPVEAVKIDRDFIVGITQNEKNKTIVQSIIDMVHKLGIEAIAEGVETEDQFMLLKEMKCDLIQGYYIGKSMTEKKVKEMVNV